MDTENHSLPAPKPRSRSHRCWNRKGKILETVIGELLETQRQAEELKTQETQSSGRVPYFHELYFQEPQQGLTVKVEKILLLPVGGEEK